MAKNEALNAKNLAFDQPGAGLQLTGTDERNISAKLNKLYAHRDEKAGGSAELWAAMQKNNAKTLARTPDSQAAKEFQSYLKTGKLPANSPGFLNLAAQQLDYGVRENSRAQQHKPVSLLEKIASPLLTIAASAINPLAGAAVGGFMGSRHGGGILGAGLGALGGYFGGKSIADAGGVSGIYNSAKNGISNLLPGSGGFSNPAGLGLTGANLGLPGLSNAGAAVPVSGYGASALGLTGGNLALPGLVNALPATPVSGYGPSAVGGDPASLYKPESLQPQKPAQSTNDKVLRGAQTGLKIAGALSAPTPEPSLMAPGPVGGAAPQMVMHGVQMRPFIPYHYFGPNTNPFMARIV
jgi:hypothetical protein